MTRPLPIVLAALALSGCAARQQDPLNAAIILARAGVAEVDAQTSAINAQVDADYEPRARACKGEPVCLTQAKAATKALLGDRMALGLAAIAAHNRAVDALDAAKKCKPEDADCRALYVAAAGMAEAEVALILTRLKRTPPLPPGTAPAPAPTSTPAPTVPPVMVTPPLVTPSAVPAA